jgi:1,4-dihydroxy-2-naphthoate octaprenyltransferase
VLQKSTIQLLRFHFSLFLLPVFLFALSQSSHLNVGKALLIFILLHLLVYPSSNGYNSYMDRDDTPIGGLSKPLQPTKQLFYTTIVMDVVAVLISFLISYWFSLGILIYILVSRAYSYRGIRLKQYPIVGFLTVFICQGALIFIITFLALGNSLSNLPLTLPLIASLLIGALYPLTQIYQHEADKKDGITTLSYLLGKRGTFLFSMILFLAATFLLFIRFKEEQHMGYFFLYCIILLPVLIYFLYWQALVWKNETNADFKHSLSMNIISTVCTSVFFIVLILKQ